MRHVRGLVAAALVLAMSAVGAPPGAAAPEGQMTWAVHVSQAPSVKRLILKSIPDDTTRLVALKRGEVDVAYAIRGTLAEELRRAPGLTLKPVLGQVTNRVYFAEQWDPKSPWHDRRGRPAAKQANRRQARNQGRIPGIAKVIRSSYSSR